LGGSTHDCNILTKTPNSGCLTVVLWSREGRRERFTIRQPQKGEKDDYDRENSWISGGLPSISRRRRRGEGRGRGGKWRDKWSAIDVDVGFDCAKSEIKVE